MAIGRNTPCPCGSGRKYKHCCGKYLEKAADPMPRRGILPKVRAQAYGTEEWEVDLFPLPALIAGQEHFRTVACMVMADDLIIHNNVRHQQSAELEEVAAAIEEALAEAASEVGAWPARVFVRHEEIAAILSPLLEGREVEVQADSILEYLDPAAAELVAEMGGGREWPLVSPPTTWEAWGLPDPLVEELFQAFAEYYRAKPWKWMDDLPPILARWEDGTGPWAASVIGGATGQLGLVVHSDPDDLRIFAEEDEGAPSFQYLEGWAVHMGFLHRRDLPRAMLKEVSSARWEVASLEAYPLVAPILTPGGGLQRDLVRRLTQLLREVAAMAAHHRGRLRSLGDEVLFWEGSHGLTLRYAGEIEDERDLVEAPEYVHDVLDKIQRGELNFEEAQATLERRTTDYNETPQGALGGISPQQAGDLLDAGFDPKGPLRISDDLSPEDVEGSIFMENARILLQAILERDGTPATNAGNLRRDFVAEMTDHLHLPEKFLEILFRYSKVVNEGDVPRLHVLRVNLEVAGLIRLERRRFNVTRKGRKMSKPEEAPRLLALLLRTYFEEFNINYWSRGPEIPHMQSLVPLFLLQMRTFARDWVSVRELAGQLLPPHPKEPESASISVSYWEVSALRWRVLDPLEGFGLLEKRTMGEDEDSQPGDPDLDQFRITPLFQKLLSFNWE